jgi:hypothetical protein
MELGEIKFAVRRKERRGACFRGIGASGKGSARTPTSPQVSADEPSAWIDPGYRRADQPRNIYAVNSANPTVADEGASSAPAVETG